MTSFIHKGFELSFFRDEPKKCENSRKGLVYFHSIRAKWNKKNSEKATVKPCIPSNRVFGGSTFDFR